MAVQLGDDDLAHLRSRKSTGRGKYAGYSGDSSRGKVVAMGE
jgi:hypothetical protein